MSEVCVMSKVPQLLTTNAALPMTRPPTNASCDILTQELALGRRDDPCCINREQLEVFSARCEINFYLGDGFMCCTCNWRVQIRFFSAACRMREFAVADATIVWAARSF